MAMPPPRSAAIQIRAPGQAPSASASASTGGPGGVKEFVPAAGPAAGVKDFVPGQAVFTASADKRKGAWVATRCHIFGVWICA